MTGEEIVLVPPHVHPTQDEHIDVLEGVFTLYVDGRWETAGPGDTVRMRGTSRTPSTTPLAPVLTPRNGSPAAWRSRTPGRRR